ncbi:hypothetical protein SETIT_2G224000v2 [Setaria italica]|uniref:Homeobox domain-containing protein n=1 Tax=Setaria italica TaxID=4555 RepID=A0A368Q3V0_SETIT|nr:hypothetical protein SETIT_2G224000v2 [Setaria italica]
MNPPPRTQLSFSGSRAVRVNWSNPPLSLTGAYAPGRREGGGPWVSSSGRCRYKASLSWRVPTVPLLVPGRMELGLSLGETMADAGRDLVLGLGMGLGVRRDEEAETGREVRREHEFGAGRCGRSSPEPAVRLTLLPGLVPSLGLPWPPSSETSRHLEASTRGFDVNRAPSLSVAGAAAEDEEEQDDAAGAGAGAAAAASSSPNNSAGSFPTDFSAQGQAGTGGGGGGDRAGSRASDEDDGGSARKKLRLSKEQSAFLEESFKEHATLNPKQKLALAKQLNLRPRQVEDEAEADGGGLRVPEALLRDADRGEPAAAEGAGGAARAQDGAPLLHAPPGHHPVHVPLLRARRLQLLRPRRRGAGAGLLLVPLRRWRRHCGGPAGAEALVVRRAVLVTPQPPAGRPAATSAAGAGELVMAPSP